MEFKSLKSLLNRSDQKTVEEAIRVLEEKMVFRWDVQNRAVSLPDFWTGTYLIKQLLSACLRKFMKSKSRAMNWG